MTHDARLRAWQSLADPRHAPLLHALHGIDAAPAPADMDRLRAAHGIDEVAAAIELSVARTRAHAKFGDKAGSLWADRAGVEMASAPGVAAWKAARFRAAFATTIPAICAALPTPGRDSLPSRAIRRSFSSTPPNGASARWRGPSSPIRTGMASGRSRR